MSHVVPILDFEINRIIDELGEHTAARYIPLFVFRRTHRGDWGSAGRFVDFQSIVIGDSGRGIHVVNATPYGISRGDVCALGVGSHQTFADTDELLLYELHFAPDLFDAATLAALSQLPRFDHVVVEQGTAKRFHLEPSAYADVERDLIELWTEWSTGTPASAAVARALFLRLTVRLARLAELKDLPEARRSGRALDHQEIVADAVRTIDRDHGAGVRVDRLADAAHLSRYRFTEVFSSVMGRTPSDYIRYVRMERAKRLLTKTVISVEEIASTTGFADHSHFTRAFRLAIGMTPREFRRLHEVERPPARRIEQNSPQLQSVPSN